MEAKKVLVALLSAASQSGAQQVSLVPTDDALRVYQSVDGERMLVLEARPELGQSLATLSSEISEAGTGEFSLELDQETVRLSVVVNPGGCHYHLTDCPGAMTYSAALRLSEEEKVQRVADALLVAAASSGSREVRLEPGDQAMQALGAQGEGWSPLLEDVVPMTLYLPIVCHLKRISGMSLGDSSVQQFGRFQIQLGDSEFQILLSANPVSGGYQRLRLRLTAL